MKDAERLKAILKQLIFSGEIRNQREFGEKLGYRPAFTSQILNGHKIPDDLPNKLYQTFGVKWEEADKKTPDESGDIQAKYIALLERQESRYLEIGKAAALEAVKEMAATYATKDDVEMLRASLDSMQKELMGAKGIIRGLQKFAVLKTEEVTGQPRAKIAKQLDTLTSGTGTVQKMSKSQHQGK
jgi:hypothetical protein